MESYRHMWTMQKKMNEDLRVARLVQEGLLPEPMNNEDVHFIGHYIPSSQLSGDLYFWQQVQISDLLTDRLFDVYNLIELTNR